MARLAYDVIRELIRPQESSADYVGAVSTVDRADVPPPRETGLGPDKAVEAMRSQLPGRASSKRDVVERALTGDVLLHPDWLSVTTLVASIDPDTSPEILAEGFRDNMRAWARLPGADRDETGAVAWLAERIGEQQRKVRVERARNESQPYLVQFRRALWVRTQDGGYELPLIAGSDADAGVDDLLKPWIAAGRVKVTAINSKGVERRLAIPELVRRYGKVAGAVIYGCWPKSHYDRETRTFRLAAAPLANIEPRFEPQVDRYLELLVGAANKPKLEDWFAGLSQLDRQCSALYLFGARGTGKNLIAEACAKQWQSGIATKLDRAVARFNDDLLRSPFVHGDERLDVDASQLRQLFETEQTIEAKNQPTYVLKSTLRILITANSPNLIKAEIEDSAESLAATSIRVIRLEVGAAAGAYLSGLPMGRNEIVAMLTRHIAHLRARGVQQPGKRYLVEPTAAQAEAVQRDLEANGDEATARTLDALVEILADCPATARIGAGAYLVTSDRVWSQVDSRASGRFTRRLIGNKLGRFAARTLGPEIRDRLNQRYYAVGVDSVLVHAEALGHDPAALRARIDAPLPSSTAEKAATRGMFAVPDQPAAGEVA